MDRSPAVQEILKKAESLTPADRMAVAQALFWQFQHTPRPKLRKYTADEVAALGAGVGPPPDDETVKRWIHEHRMRKYG